MPGACLGPQGIRTAPLAGGKKQQAIYQPGEVETWLGPLLRDAPKLNAWEATVYQWKHGGTRVLGWVAALVFLALLLLYLTSASAFSDEFMPPRAYTVQLPDS